MSIESVIQEIEELFQEHNYDKARFTVDYDPQEQGIYCFYTPFIDNKGFFVSDYLLYVDETSVEDLTKLRDYMTSKGLKPRAEAYWEPSWGKEA